MPQSDETYFVDHAFWHRDELPLGFYEGGQSVAILPNILPRPWIVVEHELSHVNLVRRSSLGLLQTLVNAADGIVEPHEKDRKLEESSLFQAKMLRYTVDVHEAVAWFCTELLTESRDPLLAPKQFRDGVERLHGTLAAFREEPYKKRVVEIIDIAEAIGMVALSPSWMLDVFKTLDGRFIQNGCEALFAKRETPWRRFCRLCRIVAASDPLDVVAWANWVSTLRPKQVLMPPLNKRRLMFSSDPTKHSLHLDSKLDRNDILSILRRLSTTALDDNSIKNHWILYRHLNLFDFSLDRYSQVEIVARPHQTTRYDLTGQNGEELLRYHPVLIVELDMQQGLKRSKEMNMHTVFIHTESSPDTNLYVLQTDRQKARQFLVGYIRKGGIILANSFGYDFGGGDFFGDQILKDLPHCVVCTHCFRTLWFRLAIGSDKGLTGEKEIEHIALGSRSAPEDFGFLVFKPKGKEFPILMMPTLLSDVERTVSAAEKMKSPYGTKLQSWIAPAHRWAGAAEPHVEAVQRSHEKDWRQPAVSWQKIFENPKRYGINIYDWRIPRYAFDEWRKERDAPQSGK